MNQNFLEIFISLYSWAGGLGAVGFIPWHGGIGISEMLVETEIRRTLCPEGSEVSSEDKYRL